MKKLGLVALGAVVSGFVAGLLADKAIRKVKFDGRLDDDFDGCYGGCYGGCCGDCDECDDEDCNDKYDDGGDFDSVFKGMMGDNDEEGELSEKCRECSLFYEERCPGETNSNTCCEEAGTDITPEEIKEIEEEIGLND